LQAPGKPGQTNRFENNSGNTTFRENAFFQSLQSFESTVEAEAVTWLGLLIRTTYLVTTATAEVNSNTPDQCRLLLRYSGVVSIGWTLCPDLLCLCRHISPISLIGLTDSRQAILLWGGTNKKRVEREVMGRTWNEIPLLSHMCRRQQ